MKRLLPLLVLLLLPHLAFGHSLGLVAQESDGTPRVSDLTHLDANQAVGLCFSRTNANRGALSLCDAGVTPLKLANTDFGDFNCSAGVCTLESAITRDSEVPGLETDPQVGTITVNGGLGVSNGTLIQGSSELTYLKDSTTALLRVGEGVDLTDGGASEIILNPERAQVWIEGVTSGQTAAEAGTMFRMWRGRGLRSAPTTLLNGDVIGAIEWLGVGSTSAFVETGTKILGVVDGTPGTVPLTKIQFYTNDVLRLTIDKDGRITTGATTLLDISGSDASTTTEGLILPQHATACAGGTAEGQLCWEADANILHIGDGAALKDFVSTSAFSGGATVSSTGFVTVVTNANLTGPVTSTGNTTAIATDAITDAMLVNNHTVTKMVNLTTNGFVRTGSSDGTTSVSTSLVDKIQFIPAGCNNAAPAHGFDLPVSGAATPACYGTSPHRFGALDYPNTDGTTFSGTVHFDLPSDWTATGGVDLTLRWFGSSATTNSVVWQLSTVCLADGAVVTGALTYNTTQVMSADANDAATADIRNTATQTGLTITNCDPGETMFLRIARDSAHASDTYAGTARLLSAEVSLRRTH